MHSRFFETRIREGFKPLHLTPTPLIPLEGQLSPSVVRVSGPSIKGDVSWEPMRQHPPMVKSSSRFQVVRCQSYHVLRLQNNLHLKHTWMATVRHACSSLRSMAVCTVVHATIVICHMRRTAAHDPESRPVTRSRIVFANSLSPILPISMMSCSLKLRTIRGYLEDEIAITWEGTDLEARWRRWPTHHTMTNVHVVRCGHLRSTERGLFLTCLAFAYLYQNDSDNVIKIREYVISFFRESNFWPNPKSCVSELGFLMTWPSRKQMPTCTYYSLMT